MGEPGTELSTAALEAVAYLARSPNRVRLLDALSREAVTRGDLAARTPASRTTVDRIVNEFEDRGWAERRPEGTYAATPQGEHLMARFRPFVEAVTALGRLGDAVAWLPTDELTIGLEHFSDAVVREPATDPAETVEFMCDLVRDATRFRVMSDLVPPEPLEAIMAERIRAQRLDLEGVTTPEVLDHVVSRPSRADRWLEMGMAGASVVVHEGPLPCNLWVIDETVLLKNRSPGPVDESYGVPIVSTDETVRRWASELVDEWMREGTPVDADSFRADSAASGE